MKIRLFTFVISLILLSACAKKDAVVISANTENGKIEITESQLEKIGITSFGETTYEQPDPRSMNVTAYVDFTKSGEEENKRYRLMLEGHLKDEVLGICNDYSNINRISIDDDILIKNQPEELFPYQASLAIQIECINVLPIQTRLGKVKPLAKAIEFPNNESVSNMIKLPWPHIEEELTGEDQSFLVSNLGNAILPACGNTGESINKISIEYEVAKNDKQTESVFPSILVFTTILECKEPILQERKSIFK